MVLSPCFEIWDGTDDNIYNIYSSGPPGRSIRKQNDRNAYKVSWMAGLKWIKRTPLEGSLILESSLKPQNKNSCLAYLVLRVKTTTVTLRAPIFHAILHTRIPLRYKSPTQSYLSLSLSLTCWSSFCLCRLSPHWSVSTSVTVQKCFPITHGR